VKRTPGFLYRFCDSSSAVGDSCVQVIKRREEEKLSIEFLSALVLRHFAVACVTIMIFVALPVLSQVFFHILRTSVKVTWFINLYMEMFRFIRCMLLEISFPMRTVTSSTAKYSDFR
jgi:hypothetical protein